MLRAGLTGLAVLGAMQVVGESVVWAALWDRGPVDAGDAAAAWWVWAGVQVGMGVAVGLALGRGLIALARTRVVARCAPERAARFGSDGLAGRDVAPA